MFTPSVMAKPQSGAREITFSQAINEALAEEMRRDPTVFIIGEDVAEAGTPFKVLSGLVKEFGPERVIDSPSPKRASPASASARPDRMRRRRYLFGDFLTLTMDQLVNQAAKIHYSRAANSKCRSCYALLWPRRDAGRAA